MNLVAYMGGRASEAWRRMLQTAAWSAALLKFMVQPARWPRTTRQVLARQIMFTGLDAIPFTLVLSAVLGVAVVLQTKVWLARMGQSALAGPILVAVIVRELGPLLMNFVVIGRSGTAIAAELASMRVTGELEVLESQGIDPGAYLVLPRALGMAISVLGLSVFLTAASLTTGFVGGLLLGTPVGPLDLYLDSVLGSISWTDVVNLLAKSLIPGWVTAIECAIAGTSAGTALTEIPRAVTRGVMRSVSALLVLSIAISLLTYL